MPTRRSHTLSPGGSWTPSRNAVVLALTIALLWLPVSPLVSSAQAQPVTAGVMTIYRQGQTIPVSAPIVLPPANFQCGQAAVTVPVAPVPNPLRAAWPDPTDVSKDCVYLDPGNGPLAMLPFDATAVYRSTVRLRNMAGDSGESPLSNPFTRPGVPPATPARLVIVP